MMRIDIVIPVYNEEAILEKNIVKLQGFLSQNKPCSYRIVIVDDGSTDKTPQIGKMLSQGDGRISFYRLAHRGKTNAIRYGWEGSRADILGFVDIDLCDNINRLPQVMKNISVGYDLVVGSRLLPESRMQRRLARILVSKVYNFLIRVLFRIKLRDFQCGYKFIVKDAVNFMLPRIRSDNCFFDTELLLFASRHGFKISEVAIDCCDVRRSRINTVRVGFECLTGILRFASRRKTAV